MTRFTLRLLIVGCIAIVPVAGVAIGAGYALGVRITNTGTTNMTIKKGELDLEEQ